MVKIELNSRETYLTYLAVKQLYDGISQYPDPLHEALKIESADLLAVWIEALESENKTLSSSSKKQSESKR